MTMPIFLFAAGLGTRMGPLTKDKPKPLVNVAGKALIDHALELATEAEVTTKVVNLHYRGRQIRDHLAGMPVVFSDESAALLETGGGLRHALPLLNGNPVLTMNTDAVWKGPNPVQHILRAWHPKMEALLLIVEQHNAMGHTGPGDFRVDAVGQLHRAPEAIFTGLQIIRTDVLWEIDKTAFSMNLAWDIIAERGALYGAVYDGQWCDVGRPASIAIAEAMLNV